jgi:hypothetical protein
MTSTNEKREVLFKNDRRGAIVSYLLRFAISVLAPAGLLAVIFFQKWRLYFADQLAGAYFIGKLNVYHDIFYVLLFGLALLPTGLWILGKIARWPWRIRWAPISAVLVAMLSVGLLPLWFAKEYFSAALPPAGFWISALYLAFNLTLVVFYEVANGLREKIARSVNRTVSAMDFLAPLLVWRAYRLRHGRKMAVFFALPYGLLALAQFVPWLLDIYPAKPARWLPPAYHYLSLPTRSYQVAADPTDGRVVVTDSPNWIRKIDPVSGLIVASAEVAPHVRDVQAVGIDLPEREIYCVDAVAGYTFVYDLGTLALKRQIRIVNPHPSVGPVVYCARTLIAPGTDALFTFDFGDFAAQLNRAGDRIIAYLSNGQTTPYIGLTDAVIDPQRRLLHGVLLDKMLIAWDIDRRRVVRALTLPSGPDRILLDDVRNRLIIPLPVPGQLIVVDAETYRQVALLDTFPSVRALTLSQQSKRLFIGCVAPFLEIRSLEDYALIDRIAAPAWCRWLDVDDARHRLFMITLDPGLYWIDLARLRPGGWWSRSDPFFFLFRKLAGAAEWANRYYRERQNRRMNARRPPH